MARLRLRTDGSLLRLKVDGTALLLRVGEIIWDGVPIDRVRSVSKAMDAEGISASAIGVHAVTKSMSAEPV